MLSRAFGNVLSRYLLLTPCSDGSYCPSIDVVSFEEQLAEGIIKTFLDNKGSQLLLLIKKTNTLQPSSPPTATNRGTSSLAKVQL